MKKFVLVLAIAGAGIAAPAAASDPYVHCLIKANCFYDHPTNSWICPDPSTYMLCVD